MPYAFRVKPGDRVRLRDYNPNYDAGLDKQAGIAEFQKLDAELDVLQEELYAAGQHSVLVILQGMDTSGKDGTIRHVLQSVDPQGCRVESFKAPTQEEQAHDFLWRIHKATPRKGMFGVFNRSHYEDVLIVRVHDLVPRRQWKARYGQINAFEELLAANDTLILKFFLHISRKEQQERLLAREQEVEKAWKLNASDWSEREHWGDYIAAYEDAISQCNSKRAPWYIVPANRKWYRNLAVCETLVETLREHRKDWRDKLKKMSHAGRAELEAFRAKLNDQTSR